MWRQIRGLEDVKVTALALEMTKRRASALYQSATGSWPWQPEGLRAETSRDDVAFRGLGEAAEKVPVLGVAPVVVESSAVPSEGVRRRAHRQGYAEGADDDARGSTTHERASEFGLMGPLGHRSTESRCTAAVLDEASLELSTASHDRRHLGEKREAAE